MPLAEKTRFGPYEIISLLGAGGMGEVYEARDTRLERTIAIKICKGSLNERFEREARAISSLNHPHICALYDIGREDSVDFLAPTIISITGAGQPFVVTHDGQRFLVPTPVEKTASASIEVLVNWR